MKRSLSVSCFLWFAFHSLLCCPSFGQVKLVVQGRLADSRPDSLSLKIYAFWVLVPSKQCNYSFGGYPVLKYNFDDQQTPEIAFRCEVELPDHPMYVRIEINAEGLQGWSKNIRYTDSRLTEARDSLGSIIEDIGNIGLTLENPKVLSIEWARILASVSSHDYFLEVSVRNNSDIPASLHSLYLVAEHTVSNPYGNCWAANIVDFPRWQDVFFDWALILDSDSTDVHDGAWTLIKGEKISVGAEFDSLVSCADIRYLFRALIPIELELKSNETGKILLRINENNYQFRGEYDDIEDDLRRDSLSLWTYSTRPPESLAEWHEMRVTLKSNRTYFDELRDTLIQDDKRTLALSTRLPAKNTNDETWLFVAFGVIFFVGLVCLLILIARHRKLSESE